MRFNKDIAFNQLPPLPPAANLEIPEIFKLTIKKGVKKILISD